ncbi:MAG: hypothetical protein AB7O96_00980 [Pseudobdellovibrionaceae bacterium]
MSNESKDKPAFPIITTRYMDGEDGDIEMISVELGLSKLEYAAIHLKVPVMNTLDEMIQKARRDEFAKAVVALYFGNSRFIAKAAYESADDLMKAADEGSGEE